MPGLLAAEQVARAADLQVLHGHLHPGPQIGVGGDGAQALQGRLGQRLVRGVEEVGVGPLPAASHAPAQLVELGQAHAVGAVDDEGVGVGHVQPGLHDRGAHEDVGLLAPEGVDDGLQLVLVHLPVGGGHARLGDQLGQARGGGVDVLDPVVDEEHLPLAQQLAADRGGDLLGLVGAHVGEDRVAVLGRGRQGGHLAQAGDRHLQGPRDRGGGHRQDVHVGAQRLEGLLVLHPETLLLVDNDQAEVLEPHLAGDEAVGADDDVDAPLLQALKDLGGLGGVLEAGQGPHGHREAGVALSEGLGVLAHQQRGGHQDRHLLAVLDGLEGGAHGDLGLAVADVAAHEPVHRLGLLHVGLDLVDGGELVGGLGVGERLLQLGLPGGVGAEGVAGGGGAGCVESHELSGDLAHGLAGLGLGLGPVGAAHLAQGGAVATDVLGDLVQGVGGHQEAVAGLAALGGGVLDDEVLAGGRRPGPAHGAPAQLDEAPHPVLGVDHEVPGVQGQGVHGAAGAAGRQAAALAGACRGSPGEVGLGDEGQAQSFGEEAVAGAGLGDAYDAVAGARRRGTVGSGVAGRTVRLIGRGGRVGGPVAVAAELGDLRELVDDAGGYVAVAQELGHAPAGSGPVGRDDDGPALAGQPPQVGHRPLELAAVGARVAEVQAGGLGAGGQGGEGPPAAVGGQGQGPGLGQVGEGGGGQVDGDRAAGGRRGPGRGEELGGGGREVLGALAHPLGLQQHREPVADEVEQRDHRVDQHRGEGLHALDGDALADLLQHVGGAGDGVGQGGGALADRVGEDQFAAGGGGHGAQRLDGALVGDGEGGDLVDLVTEEVHAHRPRLGGREDVEDAAAHGVLAAGLDHVDARVGGGLQTAGGLLQAHGQTGGQLDGLELAEPGDDGRQQGAHGDDEDADRPAILGMGQAAQDGQALGHGVGAR